MRVLMLGWEYPPWITGGLGVACHGLVSGLLTRGVEVLFLMPSSGPAGGGVRSGGLQLQSTRGLEIRPVEAALSPYRRPVTQVGSAAAHSPNYGWDLFAEFDHYTERVQAIAERERFDWIHAHDWMTWSAAAAVKARTGKPFIAHVHSIERDRGGEWGDARILAHERNGLARADRIIAVSHYTRRRLCEAYQIESDRVEVVHNAILNPVTDPAAGDNGDGSGLPARGSFRHGMKVALFVGRLAAQKGPEFFLWAAQRVLAYDDNVLFVIAGGGDMTPWLVQESARLRIASHVVFTGNVNHDDIRQLFELADVFVLPSRSEPFGLSAAEAMQYGVPCIISRDAGVAELSPHCLRVDFWDIEAMADRIYAVLHAPNSLGRELSTRARAAVCSYTWTEAADRVLACARALA